MISAVGRFISSLVLCLALGALTSIALAWAIALSFDANVVRVRRFENWIGSTERGVAFFYIRIWNSEVVEVAQYEDASPEQNALPTCLVGLPEKTVRGQYETSKALLTGLPFRCMYYSCLLEKEVLIRDWDYECRGAIRGFNPFIDSAQADEVEQYLPLNLAWTGFALNTIVFAGAWMLVPLFMYLARRCVGWRRTRRNHCRFCNYDLSRSEMRCPECGKLLIEKAQFIGKAGFGVLVVLVIVSSGALVVFAALFGASSGAPPIIRAAYKGDSSRVRRLISEGADPNLTADVIAHGVFANFTFSLNPVIAATASRDADTLRTILEAGGDPNAAEDPIFPISIAAENGDFELANLLLEYGADPALVIGNDVTPLALSATSGNVAAIQYLIQHGARPSRDTFAIMISVFKCNHEVAKLLLENGADPSEAMFPAVRIGDCDIFQKLIECGADPAMRTDDGSTLLFVMQDDTYDERLYNAVLSAGVDMNTRDSSGRTALHKVAAFGYPRCVLYLLKHGADPNVVDEGGLSPLRAALDSTYSSSQQDSNRCVHLLLAHHADPSFITDEDLAHADSKMRDLIQSLRQRWQQAE